MTGSYPKTDSIEVKSVRDQRHQITAIGDDYATGTYVLRFRVPRKLKIACGRFKGGKLVTFEPGDYSYVGSATGRNGAHCLAGRIAWHSSRSGKKSNHAIRRSWIQQCQTWGLGKSRTQKGDKLRWNVDHPLDRRSVRLIGIYAIRWPFLIERAVGRLLENDPATVMFETYLGANDYKREPGTAAHLLRVDAGEEWWGELPAKLVQCAARAKSEIRKSKGAARKRLIL